MKNKLILIAIIFLALFLRIYKLDAHGIWNDEKASVSSAIGIKDPRGSFIDLPDDTVNLHKEVFSSKDYWEKNTLQNTVLATIRSSSGNSFFYIFILHYWICLFGIYDYIIRIPSVIFGLLSVIVGYFFTKEIFKSTRISIIACILLSIHPLLIAYSQEVRGYSLAIFTTFFSSYLMFKIVNSKDSGTSPLWFYVAYILAGLASLFTHYITLNIFLVQLIFILIFVRGKKRWHLIFSMVTFFCLFFILWFWLGLPKGLMTAKTFNEGVLSSMGPGGKTTFFSLCANWTQALLAVFGNYFQWLGFRVRVIAPTLLLPLIVIAICWRRILDLTGYKNAIFLVTAIFIFPIFATVAAIKSGHILSFQPRYFTFSIPYAVALIALCTHCSLKFPKIKKAIVILLLSLQVLIMLISIKVTYADVYNLYLIGGRESRKQNPYIKLAKKIISEYKNHDVVIYSTWVDAQQTNLYLKNYSYIVQKVDETQIDKVILVKADEGNKKIDLFNFEKDRYRY